MAGNATLRQEIHAVIDTLSDRNLYALRPLLSVLSDEPIVIETDLTSDEHALIAEGVKRYHEHPEEFVSLESILKN